MFKKKFAKADNEVKTVAERIDAIHQVAVEMDRIMNSPERFRVAQATIRAAIARKRSEAEYWETLAGIQAELEQRQWEISEPKAKSRRWFRP